MEEIKLIDCIEDELRRMGIQKEVEYIIMQILSTMEFSGLSKEDKKLASSYISAMLHMYITKEVEEEH